MFTWNLKVFLEKIYTLFSSYTVVEFSHRNTNNISTFVKKKEVKLAGEATTFPPNVIKLIHLYIMLASQESRCSILSVTMSLIDLLNQG